ncbi:branched-chain amino acid aminotransferase 1, mitochondrial-like isoform X3 [Prosopis cineraria]|uniref:branched-chain amino acid aminotransferase 1, mitochondrial-like isoform X3 n=1 Tax=Prosopis cineraria TaxID=364024 RepID=UPI00240EAC84|nr:branched-chain amino acid aminotransferase 1, mitochondrial-like isoform X3 [Prosopis cineraria]
MASPSVFTACESAGNSSEEINWDEIGFGIIPTDSMYLMKCPTEEDTFSDGSLVPYGNLELTPSAGILNYGQGVFEGLKANRTEDGRILLFRPEENGRRMKTGADRMCMPSPSVEQFVNAVKQTVLANKRWVPPLGKGSLYIRPLLMGTGSVLGLTPAPEYTLLVYATPVKTYHKGPLNLVIKDKLYRAISGSGGTGRIKSVVNYSPAYKALKEARAEGFSDILYLDAATGKFIEELSSCNVFLVKVMERAISVEELMEADEVFCTGTAVGVNPVLSITYNNTRAEYKAGAEAVSQKLCQTLVGIQTGQVEDARAWTLQIE